MAEFRYNPETDAFCLLELNPRYWGGLPTAIKSGVDFPLLHLRAALGEPLPQTPVLPLRQVEGRWLLGELRSVVDLLRQRHWRKVGTRLYSRRSWPVYWDDVDWRRPGAFGHQVRAYYRILKRHGNAGGHRQLPQRVAHVCCFDQLLDLGHQDISTVSTDERHRISRQALFFWSKVANALSTSLAMPGGYRAHIC